MNPSMLPRYPQSRHALTHETGDRSDNPECQLTLQHSAQGRRQLKRLHWVMIVAGLLLLVNVLLTVTGLGHPLYDEFHPAANPDPSSRPADNEARRQVVSLPH